MPNAQDFVDALRRYIGVPYLWGGKTSAGLDCSGLITLALADIGVPFVHGSINQIAAVNPIPVWIAEDTPGALTWRPGHDAISLGDGHLVEAILPAVTETVWTDELRGRPRWEKAGLIPGIDYGEKGLFMSMVSPFEGRKTADFEGYPHHKGMDIAPPIPGQTGLPIYAAFTGRVRNVVNWSFHGNKTRPTMRTWARDGWATTGNGCTVTNTNGYSQTYNHMNPVVRNGQWVNAGDLLGYNDRSGNQSGPHLHFECVDSRGVPYDPRVEFNIAGVRPGTTPAPEKKPEIPTPVPEPLPVPEEDDVVALLVRNGTNQHYVYTGSTIRYLDNPDELRLLIDLKTEVRTVDGSVIDGIPTIQRAVWSDRKVRRGGKDIEVVQELADTGTILRQIRDKLSH